MGTGKRDEGLETLKKEHHLMESVLRDEENLDNALGHIERWMDLAIREELGTSVHMGYFITEMLPKYIFILLRRSDVDDEMAERVTEFFNNVLQFALHMIPTDYAELYDIIARLLSPTAPFYVKYGEESPLDDGELYGLPNAEIMNTNLRDVPTLAVNIANSFVKLNGLDKILKRLKEPKIHLYVVKAALSVMHKVVDFISPDYFTKYVEEVRETIFKLILNLANDELKNEDTRIITEVARALDSLCRATDIDDVEVAEVMEKFMLEVAHKCFLCPFLDKRFFALSEIKSFIVQMKNDEMGKQNAKSKASIKNSMWMTTKFLVDWIKEKQILEQLYEGLNIELIKRCTEIIKFMASVGELDKKYLDLIWDASMGKHESIKHTLYNSVGDLASQLPLADLDYIYEKIARMPYSEYDQQTLMLIRNFTGHAINGSMQLNLSKKKWYGLQIFWEMLNTPSLDGDLRFQASNSLCDFLNWSPCYSQRVQYMEKCVENVRKGECTTHCLKVLVRIIGGYPESRSKEIDCVSSVIEWLQSVHGLLDVCLDELLMYKKVAQEAAAKCTPGTNFNLILVDNQTHHSNIAERLDFLDFVLLRSDLSLTREQMEILWTAVIKNALTPEERDIGFAWLENARGPTHVSPAFSDDVTEYLFTEKIPELDFSEFSTAGVSFFEFFFRWVNWKRGKFEQEENHDYMILSFDLVGMENLWKIALQSEDAIVGNHAILFLNNLYKNLSMDLKPLLAQQREEYIRVCMNHLVSASKDIRSNPKLLLRVDRCLALLKTFLDEFENKIGVGSRKHGGTGGATPMTVKITVIQGPNFPLEMYSSDTVGVMRQKVSEEVAFPANMLRLIAAGRELKNDNETLAQLRIAHNHSVHVARRMKLADEAQETVQPRPVKMNQVDAADESAFPSHILSKQEYFDQLFDLLNLDGIAEKVWDLLMMLPTNKMVFSCIFEIKSSASPDWNQLLDTTSTFKLLYALQIVESLLRVESRDPPEQQQEKLEWRKSFVSLGGLAHLLKILLTNGLEQSLRKGGKDHVCWALLLKITNHFVLLEENGEEAKSSSPVLSGEFLQISIDQRALVQRLLELTLHIAGNAEQHPLISGVPEAKSPEVHIVREAMRLLVACALSQKELLDCMLSHPQISQWTISVVLRSPQKEIREIGAAAIELLCDNIIDGSLGEKLPLKFFLKLLLSILSSLDHALPTCEQYFLILNKLVSKATQRGAEMNFVPLIKEIHRMIQQHPIIEKHHCKDEDHVLIGLLSLIENMLNKNPSQKLEVGSPLKENLIGEIFDTCLFDIPTAKNHGPLAPPKCKTKASREAAFRLLVELCKDCVENFQEITDRLLLQHPRDTKRFAWNYLPSAYEKSSTGYVGLKNLGATCYMNSLMQQFYMIPQFRYGLLSIKLPENEENREEMEEQDQNGEIVKARDSVRDSLLYQLQAMMAYLQEGEKKFYDTKDYCRAYKPDGQSVNPLIQMDADEYFNMLLDKLETLLKGTEQEHILKNFFGGSLCHQIMSKECEHVVEREEKYFTLSVEIKNKKSILESLDLYVQGDMLEGDNKYHCGTCDKKVDALKRCCIKELPDHLIIHAKRFEFDLELFKRIKLNDYCEFPNLLNMNPYTKEGLEQRENPTGFAAIHPPSHYEYRLAGILVHTGTADSGHYYSFIRARDNGQMEDAQWFQFNDTEVDAFDPQNIPKDCYGGVDTIPQYDVAFGKFVPKFMQKMYNAYMLFYDKIVPENVTKGTLTTLEQSKLVPPQIYRRIWDENMSFFVEKNIFDLVYSRGVMEIISLDSSPAMMTYDISIQDISFHPTMQSIILGTTFLFVTLSHAKEKPSMRRYTERLKGLFSRHIPGCKWFLQSVLEDNSWLNQALLICTVPETREILAQLIVHVLSCVAPFEREFYMELVEVESLLDEEGQKPKKADRINPAMPKLNGRPRSLVIQVMDTLLGMLHEAPSHWQHFSHLFFVLKEFASLGPDEKVYFASRNIIAQLVDFYLGDDSPFMKGVQQKRRKMGDKFTLPTLSSMMELILVMVNSSSKFSRQDEACVELSKLDLKLLENTDFYYKAVRENVHSKATAELAARLSWEDTNFTTMIIDLCNAGIDKLDHEAFKPYFEVLSSVLALRDSLQANRINYFGTHYLKVIAANLKFRTATVASIKFLVDIAPSNFLVSQWLLNHMDHWVEAWTLANPNEAVREMGYNLITALIPDYPKLPPHDIPSPVDSPSEITMLRVHKILRHLLSLLPRAKDYSGSGEQGKVPADYDINMWRLVHYFQVLRWLTPSKTEKLIFSEYFPQFGALFAHVDALRLTCDENKRELVNYFLHILEGCPENVKILTKNEKLCAKVMDYCASSGGMEKLQLYNQVALPAFYSILHIMVTDSPVLLERLKGHANFTWALQNLFLATDDYVSTSTILFEILKMCCEDPKFRMNSIPFVVKGAKPQLSLNALRCLQLLLVTNDECIKFCTAGGLNVLSAYVESIDRETLDSGRGVFVLDTSLELFNRSMEWMFTPNISNAEESLKSEIIQHWDTNTLLFEIFGGLKQHGSIPTIVDRSCKLVLQISMLDYTSLETAVHRFQKLWNETAKIKRTAVFYEVTLQICDFASNHKELKIGGLVLNLAIDTLGFPATFDRVFSLMSKMWASPLGRESIATNPLLESFLIKVLNEYPQHLDNADRVALIQDMASVASQKMDPATKSKTADSMSDQLREKVKHLKEAVQAEQAEHLVVELAVISCIHAYKSLLVFGGPQSQAASSEVMELAQHPTLASLARREELLDLARQFS